MNINLPFGHGMPRPHSHLTHPPPMQYLESLLILLLLTFASALGIDIDASDIDTAFGSEIEEVLETSHPQELRIIDGDTIEMLVDDELEKIRFIGIDTPELNDDRELIKCFAQSAKQAVTDLLGEQTIHLEADSSQDNRDRYNRLLRYVILEDGSNINLELIKQGYAYEYTYRDAYKYQKEFQLAEQEAQEQKRGLWGEECK